MIILCGCGWGVCMGGVRWELVGLRWVGWCGHGWVDVKAGGYKAGCGYR